MSIDYLNGCCSVNRNGYSVYDFNHHTIQQLLCEFFTKINECVDSSNKALEFMEWVKEEGLPIEVVKYLNQMLEDGTLADLINKTIFEDLNSRLETMEQQNTLDFNKETILVTAFNGVNGTTLDLYLTNDGVNLTPMHFNKILNTNFNGENVTRDFSIIKIGEYYYLAFGTNIKKDSALVDVIGFAKTKDFINYETWYYEVNGYSKAYAPQFYREDNNVYVLVSVGNEYGSMKQHYIKALNNNLTSFGTPVGIITNITEQTIDASIYNELGKLHMFIKKEDTGIISHYTSDVLNLESAVWNFIQDLNFSGTGFDTALVEGGSLVKINDLYYFYGCKFAEEKTAVITSRDLISWSAPMQVKNPYGVRTKHFDTMLLDSKDKYVIKNFMDRNGANSTFHLWKNYLNPFYDILTLDNYVIDEVFTPSKDHPNAIYVTGGSVVIKHIKTDTYSNSYKVGENHYKINNLKLMAFNTGSITLKNQVDTQSLPYIKNIICPTLMDFVINKDNYNTESVIELDRAVWTDKFYRVKNAINVKELIKLNSDSPVILRRSLGSNNRITSSSYQKIDYFSYDIATDKNSLLSFNGSITFANNGNQDTPIKFICCFGDLPSDVEMYEVYGTGNRVTLPLNAFLQANKTSVKFNLYINTQGQECILYRFNGCLKRELVNTVTTIKRNDNNTW